MPSAKVTPVGENGNMVKPYGVVHDTKGVGNPKADKTEEQNKETYLTPYEKVLRRIQKDDKWNKEINLEKRIGFYKFHGELGSGNFSQVKMAIHHLTKERVAIKMLDKSKLDQKTQKMLTKEIDSMESLHHPHLIRLFEVIETHSKIYLVMEYAGGGELFHRISNEGRFTEEGAKPIYAQITSAVDHMHQHNIIHRDLKAENVFFVSRNIVKVGDFGFSTKVKDPQESLRTFCGSPPYAAPELFKDDSYMGPAVDAWAMGILLYFMLTASMPFRAPTVSGLKKLIVEADFFFPPYVSEDCKWLISGLLRKDPSGRFTIEQIKQYRWLTGFTDISPAPVFAMQNHKVKCENSPIPEQEVEARRRLTNLGITETMLLDTWDKGVKSNLTGTYRITMHKLLNPANESEKNTLGSNESLNSTSEDFTNCSTKITNHFSHKKSRACNII